MGELYDSDILEWSERQAELLRRHAAGERLDESPDWSNIIEEVESVGREQLHSVESLLVQALAHMLKARAWPSTAYVPGWEAEARRFRGDAAARFTPSMCLKAGRPKLDLVQRFHESCRFPSPKLVTRGLDPRVHGAEAGRVVGVDRRVKPGGDEVGR